MLLLESTLSSDGAVSPAVRLVGFFNVDVRPSADWQGQLRIQYSFDDAPIDWGDELTSTEDTDWGSVTGRLVGLEHERGGVWYRVAIPTGGYTAGSITVRFSQ